MELSIQDAPFPACSRLWANREARLEFRRAGTRRSPVRLTSMDRTLLIVTVGGFAGGLLSLLLLGLVGWIGLSINARGFSELT
jgi:hypothetical protein